ncbi:ADP-ribosylation factor-related protein 1 [Hordeum vulgare]|nr:ADP-ribosylation factor-related protein 1 [Hordeum vulgare]
MSVPWSDVHLPNNWHLFVDRVPIQPLPTSGRARRDEIERHCRLLPDDLYYDDRYVPDSVLWDTWLADEHDVRRASYFVGTVSGPRRPRREVRGRTRVRGLTPTSSPSPSPSPPPPPRMTAQEEDRLMHRVMKDSMITHDERQWPGLEDAMALSAAGDVAIPELMEAEEVMEDAPVAAFHPDLVGQQWSWSCTAPKMAHAVRGVNLRTTPPRSPERDASSREEVVHAPTSFQPAPAHHGPPTHLWTSSTYVDLVSDDDDTGGH